MRTNLFLLFMLVAPISFLTVGCDNDDDPVNLPTLDVMDVLSNDARFTTLVTSLERTSLDATLSSLDASTIFAPTNDAFVALGIDLGSITDAELTNVLLYHVLGAEVRADDIAGGQSYASTFLSGPNNEDPGVSILIEKSSNVKINAAADVIEADINADNGVIHAINAVLLPLDVVGHASANDNFTSLVSALGAASGDLVEVLMGEGPFTVFAPVNEAFDEISDITAGLTPDQLADVLTYHVVSGNILAGDLTDGQVVTAVNGDTFTVNIGSTVTLTDTQGNDATVVLTDVQATNGVIHVLDKVIIPQL